MNLHLDLSSLSQITNATFYPLLKDKNRFLVLRGSAGSGKSVFAAQKLILRILAGYKTDIKHRFLCIRKTKNSIRESVFAEIKNVLNEWGISEPLCTSNKTNMSFEFSNGSEIITAGLDDVEKLKSISGVTGIWIEEANQISLGEFRQINLRLRGKTPSYQQIILSFNPISRLSWIYNYFYKNERSNTTLHHSTWRDNKFLNQQYIDEIKALKDEDEMFWAVYSEGEWGILKDLIYSKWKIVEEFPELDAFDDYALGSDVGFNVPSALIFVGQKDGDLYLKELLYKKKLTHEEFLTEIEPLFIYQKNSTPIYFDSAEPALIKAANQAGYWAFSSDKSVNDGINYLKARNIFIEKGSQNIIDEIESYKWKEDKDGNVIDTPVKLNDHALDAARYAGYTRWGKSENYIIA